MHSRAGAWERVFNNSCKLLAARCKLSDIASKIDKGDKSVYIN